MEKLQTIQWFPGHMTKTKRMMQADMKLVNIVVELLDARIPLSSRNPDIDELVNNKSRMVVLNKVDLADRRKTQQWVDYFAKKGIKTVSVDSKSGSGYNTIISSAKEILKDKIKLKEEKGMVGYKIKIMVVGVPNVGKSTFINKLAKRKTAKVEDRPGVTRGKQWVKIDKEVELLDTPGILWPKFEDNSVAEKLAFTGAVKDQIMDTELLTVRLLDILRIDYKENLKNVYKLKDEDFECENSFELLEMIAKKRGMLMPGGVSDTERASVMVLDEFRSSKIGKITLDDVRDFTDVNEG